MLLKAFSFLFIWVSLWAFSPVSVLAGSQCTAQGSNTGVCRSSCASDETSVGTLDCTTAPLIECCVKASSTTTCSGTGYQCVSSTPGCTSTQTQINGLTCPTSGSVCCRTNSGAGTVSAGTYDNPLIFTDVPSLLTATLLAIQAFVVVLALVFIIVGALIYVTSAGSEQRVTWAKGAILAAVLGLAIAIAAPLFLREIGTILGWTSPSADLNSFGTQLTLSQVLAKVLSFFLGIIGVVAILGFVIGGFFYITAAGEADRADTGKKIVTYSIVGIVVALAGLVIVKQVAAFF